jgi:SHS2 domain-containing protein
VKTTFQVSSPKPQFVSDIGYTPSMNNLPYEEIEHTADLAMRVRGKDMADLLRHAAEGMLALSEAQSKPGEVRLVKIKLQAPDDEQLLVMWLEELLYGMEMHNVMYRDFEIQVLDGMRLVASMQEQPLHSIAMQIKAVTFHDLRIITTQEGLEATVVFDI